MNLAFWAVMILTVAGAVFARPLVRFCSKPTGENVPLGYGRLSWQGVAAVCLMVAFLALFLFPCFVGGEWGMYAHDDSLFYANDVPSEDGHWSTGFGAMLVYLICYGRLMFVWGRETA